MQSVRIIPFILLLAFLTACSQGGSGGNPAGPDIPGLSDLANTELQIGVSEWDISGEPYGGTSIMGIFSLTLHPSSLEGDLVSLRRSSITDTLETVDITNFLKLAPCSDCVNLSGVYLDAENHVVATIGVKHPFGVGDPLKPITGRNRADLHVFNVEGIIASSGPDSTIFPDSGVTVSNVGLLNPDGYTPYLDSCLDGIFPTDANIHPYIMHFDDYTTGNYDPVNPTGFESVTTPPPSGNLVMPMGSDYDYQDYIFNVSESSSIEFMLAIGCTYAVSADNKIMRFTPEYRIPQHNKKAASEVSVEVTQNNLVPGDTASTAELTVSVLDINHGIEAGTEINQMLAESSVSNIAVEIPGITSGVQSDYTFVSGDGRDPANPLTYTAIVTNTAGGLQGAYSGLVKVTDSYSPGLNTSPLLNGMDGIERVDPLVNPLTGLFEINEFATYSTFSISISVLNDPPVAVLEPNPATVCEGNSITFDATASYDPDGSITRYEWDWDLPSGDPADFVSDESTVDGTNISPVYDTPGETYVAVKVFDDGTPELSDIEIVPLVISSYDVNLLDTVEISSTGLQNINFSHTQDTLQHETHLACRGMEGMAVADGYVYATFYADNTSEGGIYFTRSANGGNSWDTPVKIASIPFTQFYGGCAIDAAGSEVHIAYTPSGSHPNGPGNNGDVYLLSNYSNGEGTFSEVLVNDRADEQGVGYIDVAVDPLDSNNIYVTCGEMTGPSFMEWWYYDQIRISVSNNGASGPYTEHVMMGASDQLDDNYGMDIAVSPVDGDVYVLSGEAYYVAVYRSDDNGASFPADTDHYERYYAGGYYWSRDFDLALHPTNGDIYYVALACRKANPPFPIRLFKSSDGINLSQVSSDIVDATAARKVMPAITVSDQDDVYITWADNRTGNYEIYMDHMPPSGTFGADMHVSEGNTSNERDPEIQMAPNGCDFIIIWEESGNDPSGYLNSRSG